VASSGSFSAEPSLEVALNLLGDGYETTSRDCDDRQPFSCASLPQILLCLRFFIRCGIKHKTKIAASADKILRIVFVKFELF